MNGKRYSDMKVSKREASQGPPRLLACMSLFQVVPCTEPGSTSRPNMKGTSKLKKGRARRWVMLQTVTRKFLFEEVREIAYSGEGARSSTQSF